MATQMQNGKQDQGTQGYGVTAEYYDLIYQGVAPDDIGFYLETANSLPGPVLELGCGTGRITLELAKAGHRVVGLDVSSAMLDKQKAKLANESAEVQGFPAFADG